MPPSYFQKPETALKRAEELIKVGKEFDALETLHDTIKQRRNKQWTQVHEQILLKHLELCVLLKKPHIAKDALFQYKALTQASAVNSLGTVIEHLLKLAEFKTEEAQKTSIEKVEEIDDLDQGDVPETLLLSVVSGAAAQDRMDRTVLAPWLRFLWETYRNCLELLRNNSQVEHLYHNICRQSFKFCAKYQRRTEFRKLCELLRLHLNQIQKHQHLPHVVKLTSTESLTLMQETRLHQLDTAIQMELWQEAYRSAEDVHGMMQLIKEKDSKRAIKPAVFGNYFDKLALVFWKAGNSLFHAAALLQKFIIYKDQKKSFSVEESQEQATKVLLATLSIPDGADSASDLTRHLDIEDQHAANVRLLSNLLRLPNVPTRSFLLKEISRLNIADLANDSSSALYTLLESKFAPLKLAQEVEVHIAEVEKTDYKEYVVPLREVVATKTLRQVSTIYDSISWGRLQKVIPFYDEMQLERLIVDVSKHRFVRAQIDHRAGCIRFGAADATLAGGVDLEDGETFTADDSEVNVEGIRAHLEIMYNKLRATVEMLDGDKRREELIARVKTHAINYERNRIQELERIQGRRRKIENYKEESERVKAQRTQHAQAELQKREEAKRAEEMKRLEQENIESERRRKQAEQEEVQRKIRQDQIRRMQQSSVYQAILREKGESAFKDLDPETVIREQKERLDKERQETQKRLQSQEKTFDHHVRAIHLEEMLERKAVMNSRMVEAPKAHEEFEKKRIEKLVADRERDLETWERVEKVREDAFEWIVDVKEASAEDFQKKISEFRDKIEAIRADRLAERAQKRKTERRNKWLKAKADEEKRRREEEDRVRSQLADDQRRAAREGGRGPARRDDPPSVAMGDMDWRGGARAAPQRADRMERSERTERPPMRERENLPASRSDNDGSWRSNMGAPAPLPRTGVASTSRRPPFPDSSENRGGFSTARAAPPPASNDGGGSWTRGAVVAKKYEPPKQAEAPPAPPAGKYVPAHLRNKAPVGNASPPAATAGSRLPPSPPRQNKPTSGNAGAESNNWRK